MSVSVQAPAAARILADLKCQLERAGHSAGVAELAPFGDGHSGFTYTVVVESGGERRTRVLRLSPPGARIAGPADIGRQGRIIESLAATAVPVPAVIACDSEPAVAGRAYMLIELVAGSRWEQVLGVVGEGDLAAAACRCLRDLHALVPYSDPGEEPLSPLAEARRWAPLLARAPERVRRSGEVLLAALEVAAPVAVAPRRVHGDFHYGNLLFSPGGRLASVLDWEISSLGHPLTDLGSLVVAALRRVRYPEEPNSMGDLPVAPQQLAELYGADPDEVAWFAACACFKYAAIIGYNFELHRCGKRVDSEYERLLGTMNGLSCDGLEILERGLGAAER